ncbi:Rad9-domain-containing protein [Crepidotus variabilis]|uniref:Rad9-domain-containing protein n=1 Tax=Crepidotus variabilis TaxID=179855 RepID=A0A9P6ED97_9AGAR|nr:Rad9-domain-containing protein [Crepidotus variabilis]
MQATLDASSLKTFTKALICLSKYGDELSVLVTPEFLSLSATNSSKSAYCRFKWEKQFFSRYMLKGKRVGNDEWGDEIQEVQNVTGQLMAKGLLSILRHRTVEKSVDKCELSIVEGNDQEGEEEDSLESKLILKLHCKHGILKTHRLLLLSLTTLLAPGVPDSTNESRLTIGPKGLKDLIDHFPVSKSAKSDPQLVWTFDETEVGLKSVESSIDSRGRGQLATELTISCEEFDVYEIYEYPVTIAFHLREFTATIAFADSIAQSLDLRFTDPAAPLFIDLEGDSFECMFVISTSQHHGAAHNGTQKSNSTQLANNKKRERSESETPRLKRPIKVVQPADLQVYNNQPRSDSRASSRIPGSMPPPSIVPNRSTFHAVASQGFSGNSQPQISTRQEEPLFLPSSSQMTAAEIEVLRATGLGIEDMDADELAEMLDGEGQEVDFSQRHLGPAGGDYMQMDEPDSLELVEDTGLPATQSSHCVDKV